MRKPPAPGADASPLLADYFEIFGDVPSPRPAGRGKGRGARQSGQVKPPLPNPLLHKCVEEREEDTVAQNVRRAPRASPNQIRHRRGLVKADMAVRKEDVPSGLGAVPSPGFGRRIGHDAASEYNGSHNVGQTID